MSGAAMLTAGFADPARDSQRCFRAVLEAMSRPGRVQRLDPALLAEPPHPLGRAAAAVLLTLADADTPVWLDPDAAAAAPWLAFHAGCPWAVEPGAAAFALGFGAAPPPFDALDPGTEEAPQESTTLVLMVESLAEGPGAGAWSLRGPGIETLHHLRVAGLAPGFAATWAANHARFPRGVDVILCAGDALAALPRSVRIAEGATG